MKKISPQQFGKVAVLYGGTSPEREVSLRSGQAVFDALCSYGIDAHLIDAHFIDATGFLAKLESGAFARVFNVLHGEDGENGVVQALLQYLKIPFTGSDMTACAISMEKLHCKRIWAQEKLPVVEYCVIESELDCDATIAKLGLPLCIKPSASGSSCGVSKVTCKNEFGPAVAEAKKFSGAVIAERWIAGSEFTVAVIGNDTYNSVEIQTPRAFYDYAAKYEENTTRYLCPSHLDAKKEAEIQLLAKRAFDSLGCAGWGRVDFMQDATGKFWLLELNAVPGMTARSLLPMSAKHAGLSFVDVVIKILSQTLPVSNVENNKLVVNILSKTVM